MNKAGQNTFIRQGFLPFPITGSLDLLGSSFLVGPEMEQQRIRDIHGAEDINSPPKIAEIPSALAAYSVYLSQMRVCMG